MALTRNEALTRAEADEIDAEMHALIDGARERLAVLDAQTQRDEAREALSPVITANHPFVRAMDAGRIRWSEIEAI